MACKKESSFVCRENMQIDDEKPKPTLHRRRHHHDNNIAKPPQPQSPPPPLSAPSSGDDLTDVEDIKKERVPFHQAYDGENIDNVNGNDDDDYLDSFPPGYRFCPLDEELVLHYLKKKVLNEPLPHNRIIEVNLYRYNPEKLAEQYKQYGEKEWYFFTPRDKKYRNGTRPNRAAGDGYWKATGADKQIKSNGKVVGLRKALVFYKGRPPKGQKTNWIMHEYRVEGVPKSKRGCNDMRLDDWVLCRIYKKIDKSINRTRAKEEDLSLSPLVQHHENEVINMDFDSVIVDHSMDYSNVIDNCSFMHQSSDGSFAQIVSDHHQFPTTLARSYEALPKMVDHVNPFKSLSMKYPNDKGGGGGGPDDIWSVANLDFASQLDFYGVSYAEPFINLDNILPVPVEPPNKAMKYQEEEEEEEEENE